MVVEKMLLTSNSFNFVLDNVTDKVTRINLRMPTKVVMELVEYSELEKQAIDSTLEMPPFKYLLPIVLPHSCITLQNMVGLVEKYLIQGKNNNVPFMPYLTKISEEENKKGSIPHPIFRSSLETSGSGWITPFYFCRTSFLFLYFFFLFSHFTCFFVVFWGFGLSRSIYIFPFF